MLPRAPTPPEQGLGVGQVGLRAALPESAGSHPRHVPAALILLGKPALRPLIPLTRPQGSGCGSALRSPGSLRTWGPSVGSSCRVPVLHLQPRGCSHAPRPIQKGAESWVPKTPLLARGCSSTSQPRGPDVPGERRDCS